MCVCTVIHKYTFLKVSIFITAGLDQSNWKIVAFMVLFLFFKEMVWAFQQRDVNLILFEEHENGIFFPL